MAHNVFCLGEIQRLAGDGMLKYLQNLCSGQFDYLPRLPDKVLTRIILYLDLEDIAKLATVSKQFQKVSHTGKQTKLFALRAQTAKVEYLTLGIWAFAPKI